MSIGTDIDALWKLREQKRNLESEIKLIEEKTNTLQEALITAMQAEGIGKSTGKKASVSITTAIKPNGVDWDMFYAYIHRMKYYHLLERRPSVTGCRELFETKGKVPGVEAFTKLTLNIRSITNGTTP